MEEGVEGSQGGWGFIGNFVAREVSFRPRVGVDIDQLKEYTNSDSSLSACRLDSGAPVAVRFNQDLILNLIKFIRQVNLLSDTPQPLK